MSYTGMALPVIAYTPHHCSHNCIIKQATAPIVSYFTTLLFVPLYVTVLYSTAICYAVWQVESSWAM